ncbi:MAG: biotin carboxylase [Chloroflexi bacterium]|nr:biotin carboxylase [Chloroflexota bacterium]
MEERLVREVREARAAALDGARAEAVAAQHAAGRLTARERVEALLDPGSFVEYGVLAESAPDAPGAGAADGLVCGAGRVLGRPVVVASYDRTVHRGTQSPRNDRKLAKTLSLAKEHRWPFVCFLEGDGGRPPDAVPGEGGLASVGGRLATFEALADLSGWAPTVSVIAGAVLIGHMSIAMLCDVVVATRDSVVGGAEPSDPLRPVELHEQAGDVDLVVDDEPAAIEAVRRYLEFWTADRAGDGRASATAGAIAAIVPDDRKRPYDMRRVIRAVADEGSVLELRPNWSKAMLTALARLGGHAVGIFANQPLSAIAGAIDAAAADKASRFVELCDAYGIPLIAFVDNPGYMVGPRAEQEGIARHHLRPVMALHHRSVPLYSVQIRKAYGMGPAAMSGFGASRVSPDLRLAWPSVESGGMSLEGAAFLVRRREIMAAKTPEEARAIRDDYAQTMRDLASGVRAGRTYAFDDVIEPEQTRERILAMLELTPRKRPERKPRYLDSI